MFGVLPATNPLPSYFIELVASHIISEACRSDVLEEPVSPLPHPLDKGCFIIYTFRENQILPLGNFLKRFDNPFKSKSSLSSWILQSDPLNCTFFVAPGWVTFPPCTSSTQYVSCLLSVSHSVFFFVLFFVLLLFFFVMFCLQFFPHGIMCFPVCDSVRVLTSFILLF